MSMEERTKRIVLGHNSNSSREEENSDDVAIDRISNLPESIILLILSFLPTKIAATISLLSKRWRFLWTSTFNLDFRHSYYAYCPEEEKNRCEKFAEYVDRVLLHEKAAKIKKLSLVWSSSFAIPSFVNGWLSMVRNVQEVYFIVGKFDAPIQLPIGSIFTSETVASLELSCHISISPTTAVCLPRLECLKLASIHFQNAEAFRKFITGCPRLKDLYLDLDVAETPFEYIVSSASLRRFTFYLRDRLSTFYLRDRLPFGNGDVGYNKLEIEAPSLELLLLDGPIYFISVRGGFGSLSEVYLRIPYNEQRWNYSNGERGYCNSIVVAIRAFSCAKTLHLSTHVMWALSCATIKLCTKFDGLKKLHLSAARYYGSSVRDFIQCSDSLQVLTLAMKSIVGPDDLVSLPSWRNPEDIPICLANSLKTVFISNYDGSEEEFAMISYLLQNGSVMEVMEISPIYQQVRLLQDIRALPRKSPTCKVEYRD